MEVAAATSSASLAPPPAAFQGWENDDQALMDLLVQDEGVAIGSPLSLDGDESMEGGNADDRASPGASRRKLTAAERRERHREVVRRSYHRNKEHMNGLRDQVKALENQVEKLQLDKQQQQAVTHGQGDDRTQRELEALAAESAQLEHEHAYLQNALSSHVRFQNQMHELADEMGVSDSEPDMVGTSHRSGRLQQQLSPAPSQSTSASPSGSPATDVQSDATSTALGDSDTSDEDLSPDTRASKDAERLGSGSFFPKPKPTRLGSTHPPAPIASAVRKAIGFKPMTFAAAKTIVRNTYHGILTFSLAGRAVSTGARVLGWEDKRFVDGTSLNFSLRKRFPASSAMSLLTVTWDCLADPECAEKKFGGLLELEILQRVNEDTIVAMRSMKSPDNARWFRTVYLLFRVRTRTGFLICIKSVEPSTVVDEAKCKHAADGKPVQWIDMSGWFMFEPLGFADPSESPDEPEHFEECGAQVEYGGWLNYKDPTQLSRLAMDTLSTVLRWESTMIGPLFTLPPSTS